MRRILLTLIGCLAAASALAIEDVTARVTQTSGVAATPSRRCGACHNQEFSLWLSHPHSRFLVTPAKDPRGLQAHWGGSAPGWKLYVKGTFSKEDVALAFGVIEVQVYFRRDRDGHRLLPAQWNVKGKRWEKLPDALEKLRRDRRTWEEECAGCHTTGFDGATRYAEPNAGCSSCHGDGLAHADSGGRKPILRPSALSPQQRAEVCGRCHSRGRDPRNGKPYATGYVPGAPLSDVFVPEMPSPGKESPYFWPDGTERQTYTQYQGFTQSRHFRAGLSCTTCHLAHGSDHPFNLRHKTADLCGSCHRGDTAGCSVLTNHPRGKATCVDCHMARTDGGTQGRQVHTHTFRLSRSDAARAAGLPNACTVACHGGRPAVWAEGTLRKWTGR